MLIFLILLCFVIVPTAYGKSVDKISEKINSTTIPVSNNLLQINSTKFNVVSEGDAIMPNIPALSLPKENQEFLMTPAGDLSSNKIKARKGANSSLSSLEPTVTKVYKPSILSSELLAKADLLNSDPAVDDGDERMVKIHKTYSTGHPGMIAPIVITVLVVPIFAMIGYMALKRGQEAWKNRHYKRMDFLLDGMYND